MWKALLLCFLVCDAAFADVNTAQALVPDVDALAKNTANQVKDLDINSLLQTVNSEGNNERTFLGMVFVAMAASGIYLYHQDPKKGEDDVSSTSSQQNQSSNPLTNLFGSLGGTTMSDEDRYGACYTSFEHDTKPGKCVGIQGDTAVTEVFANSLRDETHMLAKGFAPKQARKGMLYAGLGLTKGLNDVLQHLIKRAQSQTSFECEAEGSECAEDAVEETTIPASVGWDEKCVHNLLNNEDFGEEYGFQRRLKMLAHAFRSTDEDLFWGKNRLIGAAVVTCVGIAVHGSGLDEEKEKHSECACDTHKDAADEEDFDCDDGIDTTCVVARYKPDDVKFDREIDFERDLEEEEEEEGKGAKRKTTMGTKKGKKGKKGKRKSKSRASRSGDDDEETPRRSNTNQKKQKSKGKQKRQEKGNKRSDNQARRRSANRSSVKQKTPNKKSKGGRKQRNDDDNAPRPARQTPTHKARK